MNNKGKKLYIDMLQEEALKDLFPSNSFYNADVNREEELLSYFRPTMKKVFDTSPDPSSEKQKVATATMLSYYTNMDFNRAYNLVNINPTSVYGRSDKAKSFFEGVSAQMKNVYYIDKRNEAMRRYVASGDNFFYDKASEYNDKAGDNRVWENYGTVRNLMIDSVQPLYSTIEWVSKDLAVRGSLFVLGSIVGTPALGASLASSNISKLVSTAINWADSGTNQMGGTYWDLSQIEDAEGNKLDITSPFGKTMFALGSLVEGGIEVVGMEFMPGYSKLQKAIGAKTITNALTKTAKQKVFDFGIDWVKGIFGESGEEGLQSIVEDTVSNILKENSNKLNKTGFEKAKADEILSKSLFSMFEATKSMVFTGLLTGGVGNLSLSARQKYDARKYFNEDKGAKIIDGQYVKTDNHENDESYNADVENLAKQIKKGKKLDTPTGVAVGLSVMPATINDSKIIDAAKKAGATSISLKVGEFNKASENEINNTLNSNAIRFGGKVDNENNSIFIQDKNDYDFAVSELKEESYNFKLNNDNSYTFDIRNENGESYSINLSNTLNEESENSYLDPDESVINDIDIPFKNITQNQTLESLVRDSLKKTYEGKLSDNEINQVTGLYKVISKASGQDIKDVASKIEFRFASDNEALNKAKDFYVSQGLNETEALAQANEKVYRGYHYEENGKQIITFTPSKNKTTLFHEMGHTFMSFLNPQQKELFTKAYEGVSGQMWKSDIIQNEDNTFSLGDKVFDKYSEAFNNVIQNEERFADDFVAYTSTGIAPNEELKGIFEQFKQFLREFVNAFKNRLSNSTVNAFNQVINGKYSSLQEFSEEDLNSVEFQSEDKAFKNELDTTKEKYDVSSNYRIDENGNKIYLAPNGKDSNLSEDLYFKVRTPAFKKWFGDWENDIENSSKVIDENGEPKIVYHGTPNSIFDIFDDSFIGSSNDMGFYGAGFYFTESQIEAEGYGDNVYDVFLNLKKPFYMQQMFTSIFDQEGNYPNLVFLYNISNILKDDDFSMYLDENEDFLWLSGDFKNKIDKLAKEFENPFSVFVEEELGGDNSIEEESDLDLFYDETILTNKIRELGFDGVISSMLNKSSDAEIVAYNSNQIKSIDAKGFSINNPSILFQSEDRKTKVIEAKGTLVALHNISESNLIDSYNLGGMPMPSLAITKKEILHDDFGKISLIGGKDLGIELVNTKNVYNGDIYSQVIPKINYEINGYAIRNINNKLKQMAEYYQIKDSLLFGYKIPKDLFKDNLKSDIMDILDNNLLLKLLYLYEIDKKFEIAKKKHDWTYDEQLLQQVKEYLLKSSWKYSRENVLSLYDVFKDVIENTKNKTYAKTNTLYFLENMIDEAKKYEKNKETFDIEKTTELVENKIKHSDYKTWLLHLINPIFINPTFDNEGKKEKYNLKNLFNFLQDKSTKASNGIIFSNVVNQGLILSKRRFQKLEDIHNKENNLINFDTKKSTQLNFSFLSEIIESWVNPISKIKLKDIDDSYKYQYERDFAIIDYFQSLSSYNEDIDNKTAKNIEDKLSNFNIDSEELLIKSQIFAEELDNLKTAYFEAKPRKIMQPSDFKAAIVPDTTSSSLIEMLRQDGLDVEFYSENNREAVTKSYIDKNLDSILFDSEDKNVLDIIDNHFSENKKSLDKFKKDLMNFDIKKRAKRDEYLKALEHTPLIFKELGYEDKPFVIFKSKVIQILSKEKIGKGTPHGESMSKELLVKAIKKISDPVAIYNSVKKNNKTKDYNKIDNQYVVLVGLKDKNNRPIVVPIEMNKKVGSYNFDILKSVYGREKYNFKNWESQLVYIDKNKSDYVPFMPASVGGNITRLSDFNKDSYGSDIPVSFGGSHHLESSNSNILTKEQIVKKYSLDDDVILFDSQVKTLKDRQEELKNINREDVKNAIKEGFYIPLRVLEQFKDEEWAKAEYDFRKKTENSHYLVSLAKESNSFEEYLEKYKKELEIESNTTIESLSEEDENTVRRIYEYSKIITPEEKNIEFIDTYGSEKEIVNLAKNIRSYQEVITYYRGKKGSTQRKKTVNKMLVFKGVSTKVLRLKGNSSKAEKQEAIELIKRDPTPYRRALAFVTEKNNLVLHDKGFSNYEYEDYLNDFGENLDYQFDNLENPQDNIYSYEDLINKREEIIKENIEKEMSNKRKSLSEERRVDIQNAIRNNYYIPDNIISEFAGEEWADKEIEFRRDMEAFKWIMDLARNSENVESFIEKLDNLDSNNEADKKESYSTSKDNWGDDYSYAVKVFEYSRILSPSQADRMFIFNHSSDIELLNLAKILKSKYSDIFNNQEVKRIGVYKGVSPKVLALNENSSSDDFKLARTLVQSNPSAYRKALLLRKQAEYRVKTYKGESDISDISMREAFYESLGEDIEDELSKFTEEKTSTIRSKLDSQLKKMTLDKIQATDELSNKLLTTLKANSRKLPEVRKEVTTLKKILKEKEQEFSKLVSLKDRKIESTESNITKKLDDRRERVKDLRKELSTTKNKLRRAERTIAALERKELARKSRELRDKYIKTILKKSVFNNNIHDAKFAESINWVHHLFDKIGRESQLLVVPEVDNLNRPGNQPLYVPEIMRRYLPEDFRLTKDNRVSRWTIEDLDILQSSLLNLIADAKLSLAFKKDGRNSMLSDLSLNYFKQEYERNPDRFEENYGYASSLMKDVRKNIDLSNNKYHQGTEGRFVKDLHMFEGSFIHIQRLARLIDGYREGIAYDFFVKRLQDNFFNYYLNKQKRIKELDDIRKHYKITDDYMAEKIYEFTPKLEYGEPQIIKMTREQVLTAYIYTQNQLGVEKLMSPAGWGFDYSDFVEMNKLLTDKDKMFAFDLINTIGEGEVFERYSNSAYETYNINVSKEKNYFPFRSIGKETEETADLRTGPNSTSVSYVDKGRTNDRTHALYKLDLNGISTWNKTVDEQERMIAFGSWVKDANYLLGQNSSFGHTVAVRYGQTRLKNLQDFVNRVAKMHQQITGIETLSNKLISNFAASRIAFSLSSAMHQVTSITQGVRGDIDIPILIQVLTLPNVAPGLKIGEAKTRMEELDPAMKNRCFNLEISRFRDLEHKTKIERKISAGVDLGMLPSETVDSIITTRMWWGVYLTQLKKGSTEKEAIFRASEFIAETQSSSNEMDLSAIQAGKNPFLRALAQFKNDNFQHWNQIRFDLPYYAKNKMWGNFFGTVLSNILGSAVFVASTGLMLKIHSDDKDKDKWRKRIAGEVFKQAMQEFLPVIGQTLSAINDYQGHDGLGEPLAFAGFKFGKEIFDEDGDNEALLEKMYEFIAETAGFLTGAPTVGLNRIYSTVEERNLLRMLGGYWYKLNEK